jgi:hypothetical protein
MVFRSRVWPDVPVGPALEPPGGFKPSASPRTPAAAGAPAASAGFTEVARAGEWQVVERCGGGR